MKTYKKLVRDRIPDIIEATGALCSARTLSDVEFLQAANAKLLEELGEYCEKNSVEELADLIEAAYAAANALGYSAETLDRIREEKAAARGRFDKRIWLEAVEEVQK